jgi:hypothetical protein
LTKKSGQGSRRKMKLVKNLKNSKLRQDY